MLTKVCGCSPLSRQDLVCWKVALDRRELPGIDKEVRTLLSFIIGVEELLSVAFCNIFFCKIKEAGL